MAYIPQTHKRVRNPWVSDAHALNLLCEFYLAKGRFPQVRFQDGARWCLEDQALCDSLKMCHPIIYGNKFGRLDKAREHACAILGIEYVKTYSGLPRISDSRLLDALIDFKNKTGNYPTHSQIKDKDNNIPSGGCYARRFGSLTSAKELANDYEATNLSTSEAR